MQKVSSKLQLASSYCQWNHIKKEIIQLAHKMALNLCLGRINCEASLKISRVIIGFPRDTEIIEKVLNFKIGSQDL